MTRSATNARTGGATADGRRDRPHPGEHRRGGLGADRVDGGAVRARLGDLAQRLPRGQCRRLPVRCPQDTGRRGGGAHRRVTLPRPRPGEPGGETARGRHRWIHRRRPRWLAGGPAHAPDLGRPQSNPCGPHQVGRSRPGLAMAASAACSSVRCSGVIHCSQPSTV